MTHVEKMSLKFTFKNINRVASSNVIWQIIPIYSNKVFETTRRWNSLHVADSCLIYVQSKFKVGAKKTFFASQPVGVNAQGSLDQIFQIAISEYVSKFGWDPFSDLQD